MAGLGDVGGVGRVTYIIASRANVYTGSPLDRANERRDDADWIAEAFASPESLFAPVWRARNLMRGVTFGRPQAVLLDGTAAVALREAAVHWAFLGLQDGRAVFALDISTHNEPAVLLGTAEAGFTDLRAVAGALPNPEASMLAHARGLMHWRTRHRFCGICGATCEPRSAGNAMACVGCKAQHFPRTDPAVIMLVHDNGRALLGHSTRFPNSTMYSTLAGFVEPGESLEEAVAREVFEESGVRCAEVQYHSSQPWPFPGSIMLGFYARALTTEITIDPAEIADARWFSRDDMRRCDELGFSLPRADSIARRLIEDWIAAE